MDVTSVPKGNIRKTAEKMKSDGCRLVVITCTPAEPGYDITYSFDKDGAVVHARVNAAEGEKIPSIGPAYPGAFVYENEIHDLYGFTFEGMTLDFGGTFIKTSVPFPFKKKTDAPAPKVTKVKKEEAK
ncbi:MAG TPA: NADH-quinone oxidoreductase subunit C [Methanocorpusculum sp.]|nr:NADH-quinone oxidoreductase subunit C [Methanocorpusculum sp.]